MDVRDVTFEVVDLLSFDTYGPPRRTADGAFVWTPRAAPEAMDLDEGMEFPPWCLEARDVHVGLFTLALDINVHHAPRVEPASLDRLSVLLDRLGDVDRAVRAEIIGGFETLPLVKDYLVPGLFDGLERPYLDNLFPGISAEAQMTPDVFSAGLSLSRLGYYDEDEGARGRDCVVLDYRFLVPALIGEDAERREDYLVFGGRYDITNQVVTAKLNLDASVIDISVES